MADLKAWLADEQSEHDPLKLADALEEWWLYPKLDSADFIRDVIFCLRHLGQGWRPIETAPRDGTPFLAKDGLCVLRGFYKKNTGHNVVRPETLQVITRPPGSYSAAGRWFKPTHWIPEPPK